MSESKEPVIVGPSRLTFGGAPYVSEEELRRLRSQESTRLFHSQSFRRLWFAQVTSSLGDWIGLVAIIAIAARVGGTDSDGSAITLVLVARLVPGFFLGPLIGVMVDRFDRRWVMGSCDILRAASLIVLTRVDSLWGLVLVSLIIELATLAWASAKEASVPQLVDKEYLPTANSLSMVASYGTILPGAGAYALLAVAAKLGREYLPSFELAHHQQQLALLVDAGTYLISAFLVVGLPIKKSRRRTNETTSSATLQDLREGLAFIRNNARVRAVFIGLATGIFGGGMIVPLGHDFGREVLNQKGDVGYAVLQTCLGVGVAVGVVGLTFLQKRVRLEQLFVLSLFGAASFIFLASSTWTLAGAALFIGLLGLCCGSVYVLGITILQSDTDEDLRGRTIASFFTLIRVCLILSLLSANFLQRQFTRLSERVAGADLQVLINNHVLRLPGVRITLWFGAFIILLASLLALFSLRRQKGEVIA